jgi:hypothetical protein
VEDPRLQNDSSLRRTAIARAKRFAALAELNGFALRAIDIPYLQAPLNRSHDSLAQEPLLLMLAKRELAPTISRENLTDLLEFVYKEVYPDGYSTNQEENELYLELCEKREADILAHLPESAAMLRVGELASALNIRTKH